jgi:hypothetical protein
MKAASSDLLALLDSGNDFIMADLWTLTLPGGSVFRWSGADVALSANSNGYALGPVIERGAVSEKRGLEVATLDVSITASAGDLINGAPGGGARGAVIFPFYTGLAGLRNRGEGRVEFAFFRRPPFRFWRETPVDGMIGGERYRVIGSNVSETTKAMVVVVAQKI